MAIPKYEQDLHIIAKLDDEPNDVGGLTSSELKDKFDEGGLTTQAYLNETLIPAIEGGAEGGGLVPEAVEAHNASPEAHTDIRQALSTQGEEIDQHIASRANPHAVTAEQVGAATPGYVDGKDAETLAAAQAYTDGKVYALPVATETTLGGIKAPAASADQTGVAGIDTEGRIRYKPGSGGGGADEVALGPGGYQPGLKMRLLNNDGGELVIPDVLQDATGDSIEDTMSQRAARDYVRGCHVYAVCSDEAASPTSAPNTWYVPKTAPRPSGDLGMAVEVFWKNGHEGGVGYDASLVWGEPGGAENEIIVANASVTDAMSQDASIPAEGTGRYQLIERSGRRVWQYVGGETIVRQYSTATPADEADKSVPGMRMAYLEGMEAYLQTEQGNRAEVMRLVPDQGPTLPVYGNAAGRTTGEIPAGYILHLVNAGDHWQIINQPGGGGVTEAELNRPVHTTMDVEIEDDGFGGYRTIQYNDADINNHRNGGGLVQAKYAAPGGQTYTYYYSTMESDRRPTFVRTYIDPDTNKTVQVLASVGNDKRVEVTRRTGGPASAADLAATVPSQLPPGTGENVQAVMDALASGIGAIDTLVGGGV